MHYFALATDYDGTLAHNGVVSDEVIAALKRVRESGRTLVLVTGREMSDLRQIFPQLDLFTCIVAENGAVVFHTNDGTERVLGEEPPEKFIRTLKERGVQPLSVGRVIVATWEPHETTVLETIRDLGLELQLTFNKGAVMVLPPLINKASGLQAALNEMNLSARNTVGVGDAENDHAFMSFCECGVAVANALPTIKERADLVTKGDHGAGVVELIDKLLASDLSKLNITRHQVKVGTTEEGQDVFLKPYGENVLVAGTSQGGKTTLTTGIIEGIIEKGYQISVIDPEGDYSALERSVTLGGERIPITADEVLELLTKPDENVVVNLLGIGLDERPSFFTKLLLRLLQLRAETGRPHWIVIDEAHHLLPSSFDPAEVALPRETYGLLMITVEPDTLAPAVLSMVDTIIAVGKSPERTIEAYCQAIGKDPPAFPPAKLESGEALFWATSRDEPPLVIRSITPQSERRRHRRKYATGELPPERSFYFRGPEGKLNLMAHNLMLFLQLADGIDDETWLFHLRRGDYSRWFRQEINDEELADEAARIESQKDTDPQATRDAIRNAVEERYTAPA